MKNMKSFRKWSGIKRISLVLSVAMVFNMLTALPLMAYWLDIEIPIPGHMETRDVLVPSGTNGVPGHWEEQEVWVPASTTIVRVWIPDSSTDEPIDTTTGNNYFTEDRIYIPMSRNLAGSGVKVPKCDQQAGRIFGQGMAPQL